MRRCELSRRDLLLLLGGGLTVGGCSLSRHISAVGTGAPAKADAPFHYEEVTQQAGIRYRWAVPGPRPLNILQTIGNGCAFLDFDNDGNLDILLVGPQLALYKGDGKGGFTEVTQDLGLHKLKGDFRGCAVGDFDNDGYVDVYLSAYRGGALLHNEGGKGFLDVSADMGIPPQPWGSSAAFVQLTHDGRLDLVIGNYVRFGPHVNPQLCNFNGVMGACGPRYYKPEYPVFFKNEGNRFQNITPPISSGVTSGKALGIACADYDGSGHQSIAIANDEMPGDLLHFSEGVFHNVASIAGVALDSEGHVHAGMGLDWGDYDNDGRLDLVVATFEREVKNIYHNEGSGLFVDKSTLLGVAPSVMRYVAFAAKWLDADNDGWLDLIFTNGHVQDTIAEVDKTASYRQPCAVFHNEQGTHFTEVTNVASPAFAWPIVGRGLAVGDYDNDGRVDVLIVDSEGAPLLMHNITTNTHHWLGILLEGTQSNRDGLGALLIIETSQGRLLRHCHTDGSYQSASDKRVHVGLGDWNGPVNIKVRWPSGHQDTFAQIPVDRYVTLREGGQRIA
jgi:hypothetical protein